MWSPSWDSPIFSGVFHILTRPHRRYILYLYIIISIIFLLFAIEKRSSYVHSALASGDSARLLSFDPPPFHLLVPLRLYRWFPFNESGASILTYCTSIVKSCDLILPGISRFVDTGGSVTTQVRALKASSHARAHSLRSSTSVQNLFSHSGWF